MQYTYYGMPDNINDINNPNIENESIELQELYTYMTKKEESNNDKFTQLIVESRLAEAVDMISYVRDLKFNGELLDTCYNKEHILCMNEFNYVVRRICANNNYMDVIKLLQFLMPANIIFNGPNDGSNECRKLIHDYNRYCAYCIYNNNLDTAKAIYVMFEVDNLYVLLPPYYHYTGRELDIFKTTYDMILQCQDIIPQSRRGVPKIDISRFVDTVYREKVLFDIIVWYYNVNPASYTEKRINATLKKAKQIKKIDSKQILRLEQFFESINKE